jgi:hypothetical protein
MQAGAKHSEEVNDRLHRFVLSNNLLAQPRLEFPRLLPCNVGSNRTACAPKAHPLLKFQLSRVR